MLINYLLTALRNFAKYKIFSFINIAGMAISLASCILISLFVWDELQFDRYHPDGDRTYRVYNISSGSNGADSYLPIVPFPFASYMQKDFPEIESTLRIMDTYGEQLFDIGDRKIMEVHGLYAEPTVFDMLTIKVVTVSAAEALTKPNTLALSTSLSQKYFGDKNPVGESIKIDNEEFQITAVFTDPPKHCHLQINYLMSFATTGWATRFENNWQRQQLFTY